MSGITLPVDEDLNAALNDSLLQTAVQSISSIISSNGERRIVVVRPVSALEHAIDASDNGNSVDEVVELPMEMDKYISLDTTQKMCRTCLSEKADMHSLFETWEVETIAEMLTSFAAVQLSFGDGLPEKVCGECIELVGKCFAFKQLCERSESVLRCLLTQGHLQGMKHESEPSLLSGPEDEIADSRPSSAVDNANQLEDSYEGKEEPMDYHEFLDDNFQDSVTLEDEDEHQLLYVRDQRLKVNHNNLSIITNPSITIKPQQCIKSDLRRRKDRQKKRLKKDKVKMYINANRVGRPSKTLATLSRKYKETFKRKYEREMEANSDDVDYSPGNSVKLEDVTTERGFTCVSCGKGFPDHRKLIRHERIHQTVKPFECKICKKGFNESGDLKRHARKHKRIVGTREEEVGGERVPCSQCHLTFSCEGDLSIHSSVHKTSEGRSICQHCSKEFQTGLQLRRHVRIHLSDKPHKCRVCHKGFPEKGALTRHFRKHTGETREKKHKCGNCRKAYYDRHSLIIHMRTHTGEKPWVCADCGRGFIDSRLLNSHMRTHSSFKQYECPSCDKKFKHESTLTTHVRTHTGEKPYICTVCGNAFIQSSNLVLHMRTHTRERPYGCEYCNKKFSSSSSLTTHTRIHTGEKPYHCKVCEKRFARHDMTAHMRTHTGEKPFECSVCTKRFTTPGQLHQHTRIHTGERPYTCSICMKGCTTSSYLKKHIAKSHGMKANMSEVLPGVEIITTPKEEVIEPTEHQIVSPIMDETKIIPAEDLIAVSQAINTLTLTSNTLNVVAVANSNGELSITTANALNVATLTADGDNVSTIVANTLVSEEKLYQIDPSLLRIHHVSAANLIHNGQLTISELSTEDSQ